MSRPPACIADHLFDDCTGSTVKAHCDIDKIDFQKIIAEVIAQDALSRLVIGERNQEVPVEAPWSE
jgi:hypothetical protein